MRRWIVLSFLGALTVAEVAHAQPGAVKKRAPADTSLEKKRVQAEALNEEAKRLAKDHKLVEARAKFMEAYSLFPVPGVLFNAARVDHMRGEYADAFDLYSTYLGLPASERVTQADRKDAETLAAECETKICHVEVRGADTFTIDGKPINRSLVTSAGSREIKMTGPKGPRTTTERCVGGSKMVVEYEPPVAVPVPVPVAELPKANPPEPPKRTETGSWLVPGVLAGVGVVGLGVGIGLGVSQASGVDAAKSLAAGGACQDRASASCKDVEDRFASGRSGATGSYIAYAVGGVGIAGAVITTLVLQPWRERPSARAGGATIRLVPVVGQSEQGFFAIGSF